MASDTPHWVCVHCVRRFRNPVASELGLRTCRWHPGTVRYMDNAFSCCNSTEQRWCTPCDHLPAEVFALSEDDGHTLTVPAYILRSRNFADARPTVPDTLVWRDIQHRARLEESYWTSLPSTIFTAARARAEQKCLHADAVAKQNLRALTWQPYQRPPEEPEPVPEAIAEQLVRAAKERQRVAALLAQPYDSGRCASFLPPSTLAQSVAQELGHFPVPCVVVRLSN